VGYPSLSDGRMIDEISWAGSMVSLADLGFDLGTWAKGRGE
jgi:hypothetical protein